MGSNAQLMMLAPFLRGYGFVFNQTISVDTTNYNLRASAVAAGWDQVAPLFATVTIASGIVVSANSTTAYAFDTGVTFPAGSALALINNGGFIVGMGGRGSGFGQTVGDGGPALRAQAAISVTNDDGVIGGGGGGGGSGIPPGQTMRGGGGGRSGRTNSAGGPTNGGIAGQAGTFTQGGSSGGGSAGGTTAAGTSGSTNGGGGGGWGAAGGSGYFSDDATVAPGGLGGAAVVGNSNITWIATGTRYGAIA